MRWILLTAFLGLIGCAGLAPRDGDILVLGDSIMAWNGSTNEDIAAVLADRSNREVSARPVPGAMFSNPSPLPSAFGFDIRRQYPGGRWNWVVLNGGANDFGFGACGCGDCGPELERLIGADAKAGQIPDFLNRLRASGARILWMGYYASPGKSFEGCRDDLVRLDARLATYAQNRPGVYFLDAETVIDRDDRSHFAGDLTHPSPLGSALMGTALADLIARAEDRSQNP